MAIKKSFISILVLVSLMISMAGGIIPVNATGSLDTIYSEALNNYATDIDDAFIIDDQELDEPTTKDPNEDQRDEDLINEAPNDEMPSEEPKDENSSEINDEDEHNIDDAQSEEDTDILLPDETGFSFAPDRVLIKLAPQEAYSMKMMSFDLGINIAESRIINPSDDGDNYGTYNESYIDFNNIFVITLEESGKDVVENALKILNANPAVEIAEPDYFGEYIGLQDNPWLMNEPIMNDIYEQDILINTSENDGEYSRVPNDPRFREQYALQRINAQNAWNITTGSRTIVVGVIDSGINGIHPDLAPNLWRNPTPNRNGYINDINGFNFGRRIGGTPTDSVNHGTPVAGVIGAVGNNNIGVTGINWQVSLANLGVDTGGVPSLSAVIEAINYARIYNMHVVNLSLTVPASSLLESAIRNYRGLVVAAAGNNSRDNDRFPSFPANYNFPNVVSVASTDSADRLSSFSNWGQRTVHIAAPGSRILTTLGTNGYGLIDGTSFASPYVAGVAALILARNPSYTAAQLRTIMINTARRVPALATRTVAGGIVDAGAAVQMNIDRGKVEDFVRRLYTEVLGRAPDTAGLNGWVNQLVNGTTNGAQAAYGFFFSREFINRQHGNSQYVDILYRTLLGRAGDAAGRARWIEHLHVGLPREDVFAGFVNSTEFGNFCREAGIERGTYNPPPAGRARIFVTRLYRLALLREPDTAGLNGWHNALRNGTQTGVSVAYGFIFSREMTNRRLTDEQFIDVLYTTLLGRNADPIGRAGWVNQLRAGRTRYDIFAGFAHSREFTNLCADHGIVRGNAPPR